MTTAFGARLASLVQCGVTIDARYGTSDPDNSCPARNPELTYGFRRRRKFEFHGGVFEPWFFPKSLMALKIREE
jgi:hypothetical protein